MALSIREADAKLLLSSCEDVINLSDLILITSKVDLESLPKVYTWLENSKLVVKPDVLLKRRGISGLVHLNVTWDEAKKILRSKLDTSIECQGLTGILTHFIVEKFYPHKENEEMYLAIRTLRDGDELLFSDKGGVSVGDVETHASKVIVPINPDGQESELSNLLTDLFNNIQDAKLLKRLNEFVPKLYREFCNNHFAFLEINPFCFDSTSTKFVLLDSAAKVDHTAEFLCEGTWSNLLGPSPPMLSMSNNSNTESVDLRNKKSVEFPNPFGRSFSEPESYIRELDSKTGASLKLTVLNPKGRIWTLIAGGGASVVYADTLCDLGQSKELANYGEYSGAPSEMTTYEYAKTILSLVTAKGTEHPKGKILLIGGGIANFTSVADTFRGIIKALREFRQELLQFKTRIYVRRGGPYYQDGLKLMRQLGEELNIPMKVYGPETYITSIIPIALSDDNDNEYDIENDDHLTVGWNSKVSSIGNNGNNNQHSNNENNNTTKSVEKCRTRSSNEILWSETKMEDIVDNADFENCVESVLKERGKYECNNSDTLFKKTTRCFVWGLQIRAVQEMLDFDHVCGRKQPSVAALIYEFSVSHLRSFYFGTEEIFLPVCESLAEASEKFQDVDTLVNFASMRSAYTVTMNAMDCEQIKLIAVIAEGVPERHARELMMKSYKKKVTLIGPATVGGMRSGAFRIGNTGGSLENIMNAKLYRPGSVGFVTKSGGLLNELNNILSIVADGTCEGVAIGGDRFPGTTMLQHLLRYESDSNIKLLVLLGEVGGQIEYQVVNALKNGLIKKPLVAWCVGTCATRFTTEVSFGHAGAWAGRNSEHAYKKNQALKEAGAIVPSCFQHLGTSIKDTYDTLVLNGQIKKFIEPEAPRVPMDYAWAKKLGLVRKPKGFVSSISDDRGEELVYAGWPITKVLQSDMGVGGVISLLWFKRPMPDYCYRYLERVLMLTGDHGPAVCGAHNTIVAARAGKDLISSLIAGLCTIGDRFGGACDQAAQQFYTAYKNSMTADEFVQSTKAKNQLIMGIGHKIKSVHNPDMRVELLKNFCHKHFYKTPIIDFAESVEKVTTKKKDTLILNVDGLIGVSMCDMLFGCGAFTDVEAKDYIDNGCINGLFVLGRSIGFIGHYLDQKRLKQGLYRHDVDDIAYVLPELCQFGDKQL